MNEFFMELFQLGLVRNPKSTKERKKGSAIKKTRFYMRTSCIPLDDDFIS